MPSTWERWGVDANGDGLADPWNAEDAITAAARYLAASGGGDGHLPRGLLLQPRPVVRGRGAPARRACSTRAGSRCDLHARPAPGLARPRAPRGREGEPEAGRARSASCARAGARERSLRSRAARATLLSDRLDLERLRRRRRGIVLAKAQARAARGSRRARPCPRRPRLRAGPLGRPPRSRPPPGRCSARLRTTAATSSRSAAAPRVVSVSHHHHDYPAADIAAPMGSPVYALANGVVLRSWRYPDPRCGIGMTIRTDDGQTWTYCHLSYLDPSVAAGATLAAGAPVGLVGATGDATGPHLHLQLDPTASYPQDQPWFQSFANVAFRWQDAAPTDTQLGRRAPSSRSCPPRSPIPAAQWSSSPGRGMTRQPDGAEGMTMRLGALLPRAVLVAMAWILATAAFTLAADKTSIIGPQPATTAAPVPPPVLTVPTVDAQAFVFAKGILEDAGFGWRVSGPVHGYSGNKVVSQSPAAGTHVIDTGAPMIVLHLARGPYAEKGTPEDSSSYRRDRDQARGRAACEGRSEAGADEEGRPRRPRSRRQSQSRRQSRHRRARRRRPPRGLPPLPSRARRRSRSTRSRSRPARTSSQPGSARIRATRAGTSTAGSTSTRGSSTAPTSAGRTASRRWSS